ncbi:alpha-E domain-containing protein [Palleronia caenipelagi]|uniref:Alpha-E domain-containing protein n=1 Tax=Palleronia caenipelagi TaxID=2489174 RepID=A0A547Q562_9RHOB|nr:alpha-E domain-containing protein [Palleronia caenipelagi]TRD21526.1 alpha-E domain-containing protein [Palleronia caenipelagi]
MLSRTAENLFWIARYIERADTHARLLEVAARNALLPDTGGGNRNEWDSVLAASGSYAAYREKYGPDAVPRNVETHLFFDRDNPSSVASCVHTARENARIVRTALTTQVWEAINSFHAEMQELARQERSTLSISDMRDFTTGHVSKIRGATIGGQLRNDGYDFLNLGHYLERAASTARILDVKYYVLLPHVSMVGSGLDNYQWRTILQAMNSQRAFAWVYGGDLTARKIVDFLALNRQSPRSLISATDGVVEHLERLARRYGRSTSATSRGRQIQAELSELTAEDIFDDGLHEFLTAFLGDLADLSAEITTSYLNGEAR